MPQADRIAQLIYAHQTGVITDVENTELEQWINEAPKNKLLFEQLSDPGMAKSFLEFRERFNNELEQSNGTGSIVKISNWKKWSAVAAAAVLLLLATYYFMSNTKPVQQPVAESQQQRYKNDVQPANQSAVLELANGKRIYLDSASNGNLSSIKNLKIEKKGEEVTYRFDNADATDATEINAMATGKGKQYLLVLSDGSKVWMNAQSTIRFPSSFVGSKERRVEIDGEFYFEVFPNKKQPFIVSKGDMSIEVSGTQFNANTYANEDAVRTTLVEGAVSVKKGDKILKIKPGQQAEVSGNGTIQLVTDPNVAQITAWKNGLFQYRNVPIEDLMKQVQRWYDIDVNYQGKINTVFSVKTQRNLPISRLLEMLEMTGDIKFKIDGNQITVMP